MKQDTRVRTLVELLVKLDEHPCLPEDSYTLEEHIPGVFAMRMTHRHDLWMEPNPVYRTFFFGCSHCDTQWEIRLIDVNKFAHHQRKFFTDAISQNHLKRYLMRGELPGEASQLSIF